MRGVPLALLAVTVTCAACSGTTGDIEPDAEVPETAVTDDAELPDATSDAPLDASLDVATETAETMPPAAKTSCLHMSGAPFNCAADGNLTRTVSGKMEMVACPNGCAAMPLGFDDVCKPKPDAVPSTVNGHTLSTAHASWVHYVATCAVPHLEGTRDERLTNAARVTWWSLKEGVLGATMPNPVGFSLCTTSTGDQRIGPLESCMAGKAWQVGVSAVQVTCCDLAELEAKAKKLYPELTVDQLLEGTAAEAGYAPGSATSKAIVASTDSLRVSWLLHATAIGFTFQAPIVTSECITGSKSWCYGTGWKESAAYAPDKASAMKAIDDVRAILDVLSP